MKKSILLILILLSSTVIFSQLPQAFKYQAIARDEAGNLLSICDIGLRVSIMENNSDMKAVYVETHKVQSNIYGLINMVIGEGETVTGDINAINWGENRHFLKIEMDIDGGENYKEIGTSQLFAVPYALYADEAGKLRDQPDQSSAASSSKDKTGIHSKQGSSQDGSRSIDPNSRIPATGNGFLNANSGNLGVGTTSPQEKLDVNGNIRTNGSILADAGFILLDSKGSPRKVTLNPDGTWSAAFHCEGYIKDIRDGQQYNIVKIGPLCWMAENLNTGTQITKSTDPTNNSLIEKYCYADNLNNCDLYGGLYKWDELMDWVTTEGAQGICPESWHVPADWEWKILEGSVDSWLGIGDPVWDLIGWRGLDAGKNLKSSSGWSSGGPDPDSFGFTALPGGYLESTTLEYYSVTDDAFFWTSTDDYLPAYLRSIDHTRIDQNRVKVPKSWGLSLRCIKDLECGDSITDARDAKRYGTVKIGDQCWMSQNLNIGTRIDASVNQTNTSTIEKYCYGDLDQKCDTLGGLYQWDQLMDYVDTEGAQGICPPGWHVPTVAEWMTLVTYLGGNTVAGGKLKATGTIEGDDGLWLAPNTGATNESGFGALPGGHRYYSDGLFYGLGEHCYFWTSTEDDLFDATSRHVGYDYANIYGGDDEKESAYSARCLKDLQ